MTLAVPRPSWLRWMDGVAFSGVNHRRCCCGDPDCVGCCNRAGGTLFPSACNLTFSGIEPCCFFPGRKVPDARFRDVSVTLVPTFFQSCLFVEPGAASSFGVEIPGPFTINEYSDPNCGGSVVFSYDALEGFFPGRLGRLMRFVRASVSCGDDHRALAAISLTYFLLPPLGVGGGFATYQFFRTHSLFVPISPFNCPGGVIPNGITQVECEAPPPPGGPSGATAGHSGQATIELQF